ncbi:MAG: ceramidase [Chitinophagales bacterium]|nr:ceramidase [Chitinophagales bacterium]
MRTRRPVIFIVPSIVALLSLGLLGVSVWYHWMGESSGVGSIFCEVSDGIIKQPVNTYSNIGFIVVGLLIAWTQYRGVNIHNNNLLTQGSFFATFFATLSVLLGPGSMAMHATETHTGGFLDMLSMYLIASFIFTSALIRWLRLGNLAYLFGFSFTLGIQLYVHWLPYNDLPIVGFIGSLFFALFLILAFIIEIIAYQTSKKTIALRYGIFAILSMILAFSIWQMSLTGRPWCVPDSFWQGHGAWHLLCALALFFMYLFYASEDFLSAAIR